MLRSAKFFKYTLMHRVYLENSPFPHPNSFLRKITTVLYKSLDMWNINMKLLHLNLIFLTVTLSACMPSDDILTRSFGQGDRGFAPTFNNDVITTTILGERIGKRYALVIGNSKYDNQYWSELPNPVNDAQDMKEALESLPDGKKFEVTFLLDATYRQMEDAVREFGQKLQGGGIGLFYYAGHGSQIADNRVEGENYLIPVDMNSAQETDVKYHSLSADYVLDTMKEAGNGFNIIVLDACRTNGLLTRGKTRGITRGSGGLAAMKESEGAIIAFSTVANTTALDGNGRNSPYAKSLIEAIKTKDITLEQVFKQVRTKVKEETNGQQSPIEYTQLEGGDFCFVSCPGSQGLAEIERLKQEARQARERAERERQARIEAEKMNQEFSSMESSSNSQFNHVK